MQVMVVSVFILVCIGVCEAGIEPAGAESETGNDNPAVELYELAIIANE